MQTKVQGLVFFLLRRKGRYAYRGYCSVGGLIPHPQNTGSHPLPNLGNGLHDTSRKYPSYPQLLHQVVLSKTLNHVPRLFGWIVVVYLVFWDCEPIQWVFLLPLAGCKSNETNLERAGGTHVPLRRRRRGGPCKASPLLEFLCPCPSKSSPNHRSLHAFQGSPRRSENMDQGKHQGDRLEGKGGREGRGRHEADTKTQVVVQKQQATSLSLSLGRFGSCCSTVLYRMGCRKLAGGVRVQQMHKEPRGMAPRPGGK